MRTLIFLTSNFRILTFQASSTSYFTFRTSQLRTSQLRISQFPHRTFPLPSPSPSRPASLPRLILSGFRLLEITQDIRESKHAVPGQDIGEHIRHRHIRNRPSDAVVLVEQIENNKLQLGLVVFGKTKTALDVP
jgi:hypothetical protein